VTLGTSSKERCRKHPLSGPGAAQASQNLPAQRVWTSIALMSARPEEHGGSHDVIRLGGETAVVVPLDEYRMLATLRDRASADEIEEAEIGAAIAGHEAWKAAGRPGGTVSHEAAMAELLGSGQ
jgi:hypothetical protein